MGLRLLLLLLLLRLLLLHLRLRFFFLGFFLLLKRFLLVRFLDLLSFSATRYCLDHLSFLLILGFFRCLSG